MTKPGRTPQAVSSSPSPASGAASPSAQQGAKPALDRRGPAGSNPPSQTGTRTFVIDTNVVLHNPVALFVFAEHNLVIPFTVIEELDKMKRKDDDLGRNARECIRQLDWLRTKGSLTVGVNWGVHSPRVGQAAKLGPDGKSGSVRIDVEEHVRPSALNEESPDNRIIAVAYALKLRGENVTFITKDLAARIKADSLGISTEDFENQKVDADRLYNGSVAVEADSALIDEMYRDRMLSMEKLLPILVETSHDGTTYPIELLSNQFVSFTDKDDPSHTGLGRRLADTDHVIPVTNQRKPVFGIIARNVQQTMALDLLLDDEIKFVTLLGSAGTGKTLVAIAAGMAKVFSEERYDKLLVARPIMPLGRDIGYLPGDKDEKLTAWMQPIFDNLTYLMSTRGAHTGAADSHTSEQRIQKLMADGKLVLEPLTYIRGRSIPHQFMIVDEAQNLTPHEVKTIVSRVGEGTKLILTGDIQQIDNPYLDSSSNGLAYAIEKMKGVSLYGHVTLTKSERSELASIAAARL
ncbi:MAG: PhoH family protein [Planctomycetota bacterium]